MVCIRESVPFVFFIQLACLAFVLVKGLCSLFPVLLVSSAFLIYNILTFDQKKKRALSQSSQSAALNRERKLERDALLHFEIFSS
jgi:hypothetical protein